MAMAHCVAAAALRASQSSKAKITMSPDRMTAQVMNGEAPAAAIYAGRFLLSLQAKFHRPSKELHVTMYSPISQSHKNVRDFVQDRGKLCA